MNNRRSILTALLLAPFGSIKSVRAQLVWEKLAPMHISYNLDQISEIRIVRKGQIITIPAEAIWKEFQQ